MNKRMTIVFVLATLCVAMNGQQKQSGAKASGSHNTVVRRKAIDTANMRILYAWGATDISNDSTYLDLGQLQIGSRVMKYCSLFREQADDERVKWHKQNPKASGVPNGSWWMKGRKPDIWSEYQYSQLYFRGDTLDEWAMMPMGQEWPQRYTEVMQPIKWVLNPLTTESQTILGHKCQRATCHWRGRDYEAWFAPDIPIRRGPWKFGGLPGLILKISDARHLYTFEAVAIEKGSFPIWQYPEDEFKKSTRQHTWKLQVAFNRNYQLTAGIREYDPSAPNFMGAPKSDPHPYDPMELE